MKTKAVVLTGVGFVVGVAEALLFYNLGKSQGTKFKFSMPPGKEFIKTAGMVLVTSLLTTALFEGLELAIGPDTDERLMAENSKDKMKK